MRIDAINRIYDSYRTQAATPTTKSVKAGGKDAVALSETAKELSMVQKMLSDVPDVRAEKVEQLKEQMRSGQYSISAQEVADKMFSQFDIKG